MQILINQFITRPVLTSALSFLILLLGIWGIYQMPIRYLPQINQSIISLHIDYPGAEGKMVKNFVTDKIQNALVGIEGINYMTASSTTGSAEIILYLTAEAKADILLSIIRGKISAVEADLPAEVKPPVITENNVDHRPMLILGFTSHILDRVVVANYLRQVIAPRIESIAGVAQAEVWGDQYVVQIYLDPAALMAYHLVPQDVFNALKTENVLTSAGSSQGKFFDYTISAHTTLHSEEEFNHLRIKTINSVPIYLHDVGYAKMGAADDQFMVYYNQQPATFIGVQILPHANPLTVIKSVLTQLPQWSHAMPADLTVHTVFNRTQYIYAALRKVTDTLLESIVIVFIVMIIFLGNLKAALIPLFTIPLSLLGVCFFMSSLGYSLNTMTLLAMVLAVSLVVDDAIVLIEQCMRYLSPQLPATQTTLAATSALVSPIIAMTLTLAAIYLPIGFTSGLIGQLFTEFAFTLAGSVFISGLLALTLAPMLAAHWLRADNLPTNTVRWMNVLKQGYQLGLHKVLPYKKTLLFFWLGILCILVIFCYTTPKELAPHESMGYLMVTGEVPTQANRNYLMHYAVQAQNIYQQIPSLHSAVILSPDERYLAYLMLPEGFRNSHALLQYIQEKLADLVGITLHVIAPPALINTGPALQFVLQGNVDYQMLYHLSKQIEAQALRTSLFSYLTDDLHYTQPQATIEIDHTALAAMNISIASIANAVSIFMSHHAVQAVSINDQAYDVLIKMLAPYPESVLNIPVQTAGQISIPLSSVARIRYEIVPQAYNQFQKMNSVTISGELNNQISMSEGLSVLQHIAAPLLPKNVVVNYAGNTRQFLEEACRMLWIFLLALLIIFLVLSMQFESYRDAWIILLGSVPMALFSAFVPLQLGCGSLNIYTEIGLLTLVGLISKHGILITRCANEIKIKKKLTAHAAVVEAAAIRLRPILMTSSAILLASLPLIFAQGAGAESLHAIGMVIAFGIGFGTLLTLFLLPAIYIFFNEFRR